MKRRLAISCLIFAVILITISVTSFASDTEFDGIKLSSSDYYQSIDDLSSFPYTFEAWINISASAPDSFKGAIAGNYGARSCDSVVFAVAELGVPRAYLKPYNEETNTSGSATDIYFPEVDLRSGEPTHLAITFDPANNKAYCYINGELKSTYNGQKYYYDSATNSYSKYWSTSNINIISEMDQLDNMAIGRDHRSGSSLFALDGAYAEINSVAMYSELLSEEVISTHGAGFDKDSESLIAAYDLSASGIERLKDHSANRNHLYYTDTSNASPKEFYKDPGFAPESTDYYQSIDDLSSFPYTFEAWVNISASAPDSLKGAIAGNYGARSCDSIVFAVAELGVPRAYLKPYNEETNTSGSAVDIYFPEVDLRSGKPTHLAITFDPANNKAYCYINGELKSTYNGQKYYYDSATNSYSKYWSTSNINIISEMDQLDNMAIGRDHRSGSSLFALDGAYAEIYSVAMSSEFLSAEEVEQDVIGFDYENDALIAAYDLTLDGCERLKDHSPNRNHLYYTDTSNASPKEFYKDPGFAPESTDYYQSIYGLSSFPYTFEAWVNISASAPNSFVGAIAGNYGARSCDSFTFAVAERGVPRVYLKPYNEETNTFSSATDIYFPEVDLRSGKPTHLAITLDPTNNKAYCYVNGELKSTYNGQKYYYNSSTNAYGKYSSTSNIKGISEMDQLGNMAIGRDHRGGSYLFALDGTYAEIHSVAMYSRLLSAAEVSSDMLRVDHTDPSLLAAYDMTLDGKDRLKDHSANANHLFYSNSKSIGLTEWYETIDEGFEFSSDKLFRNDNAPDEIPLTLEASVYFPISDKVNFAGGVMISTLGFDKGGLCLEIGKGGTVIFTSEDKNGVTSEFVFDKVCVYKKEITHVAVTVDKTSEQISCYINGELLQSLSFSGVLYASNHIAYAIGGDYRTGNKYSFSGKIISCAAYSDVRSASEIEQDVTVLDKDSLIFAYNYNDSAESGAYPERIRDMSENGNDAIIPQYLIGNTLDSDFESSYSFAVVGDTQSLIYNYPDKFSMIYDWILDNKDDKNIRFVMGLGDITEKNTDAEWLLAKEQILKLQGVLPYSLAVGNHDTAAKLTANFEGTGYKEQLAGRFGDGLENTYQKITVGDVKYLIFSLDCGASDEALDWAGEIISSHPEHNVIITTHAYLFRDGTTLDANDRGSLTDWGYGNDGDGIWDKLVSKYENIVLVLSGHITSDEIVMSKRVGIHGNTVTEMLINPQDIDAKHFPAGLVAMLHFSEDGKNVRVEYYSTVQEQYFMHKNQFETTLETVEPGVSTFLPKMNITLDSNLIFNVHIPKTEILESFLLNGVEYTDFSSLPTSTVDGDSYYVVSIPMAANQAAKDINLQAILYSDGVTHTKGFTLNIIKYANRIFADNDEYDCSIMKDILVYINSAYDFFESERIAEIDDILGDYKRELVIEGSSSAPNITGISSGTFGLDAVPSMVFYLKEGYTAEDYVFTQNGKVLDVTYDPSNRSISIKLYAHCLCETVNIAYGSRQDSYHINAYYEFAKHQNDEKLVAIVEAFWNYCLSAREYKNR